VAQEGYVTNHPIKSTREIPKSEWHELLPKGNPFLRREFFLALEESNSIGAGTGWSPLFFKHSSAEAMIYSFTKTHSYGEYIFDWSWASAFQQNRRRTGRDA
jgi:predicted N-acyltransferase